MIFSIGDHIEMIKSGQKTQTRRYSSIYIVGRTYSIQPGRRMSGIAEGRIRILRKTREVFRGPLISKEDAWDEGHYTPSGFERLYRDLYPRWDIRYAYTFVYVPQERLSK